MKYTTHNDNPAINITGTSLQGHVKSGITYSAIVAAFGMHTKGDEYKVDAEWMIQFNDGLVATIYNYKNGKNYCGKEGKRIEDMTGDDWHIGGNSSVVADRINQILGWEKAEERKDTFDEEEKNALREKLEEALENNLGIVLAVTTFENDPEKIDADLAVCNIRGAELAFVICSIIKEFPFITPAIAQIMKAKRVA